MKKITYLILTLFLMIFFSIGEVTASKQTRGEKILRKMVDKYKNIDIYKDETSIRFETKIKDKQFPETIYSCLIQRPNKISLNLKSGVLGFTLISNGKKLWLYFPQGKEYADQMAPADLEGIFSKISLNQKFLMGEIVLFHLFSPQPYEAITAGFKQIELLGESVINGNKTFHVLLKGDLKTERHLWIDTWSYLLRKVSTDFSQSIEILRKAGLDIGNNSSIKFFETHVDISEPIKVNKEVFVFKPPEGSKKSKGLFSLFGMVSEATKSHKKGYQEINLSGLTEKWHINIGVQGLDIIKTGKNKKKQIVAVHHFGNMAIYDTSGKELQTISKPIQYQYAKAVDLNGDGIDEILAYRHWGHTIYAMDQKWNILWKFSEGNGLDDVCIFDVNKDGKPEIIIGYNGGTGLYLLDSKGKVQWKFTEIGNVWHVSAGDLEGDGKIEILSTSAKGKIYIFNHKGELLRTIKSSVYTDFVKVRDFIPGNKGPEIIAAGTAKKGEKLTIRDSKGEIMWEKNLGRRFSASAESIACLNKKGLLAVGTRDGKVFVLNTKGTIKACAGDFGRGISLKWIKNHTDEDMLIVGSQIRGLMAYSLNYILSSSPHKQIVVESYHDNGEIKQTHTFKISKGKKVLITKLKYDDKKKLISSHDVLNHTEKQWKYYKNGQKEIEKFYKNGKSHGTWRWWHKNGNKKGITGFKNGFQHGKEIEWEENGKKSGEGFFKKGTGNFFGWYSNGKKRRKAVYEHGIGYDTEWYKNGHKKREVQYKKSQPHGKYTEWYENGLKQSEGQYKDGKEIGQHIEWFKNGRKKYHMEFKEGKLHGKMIEWHENGQKKSEVETRDGKPQGKGFEYFDNGQKKAELEFKNGKVNGMTIQWFRSGKKQRQVAFKDNEPDGKMTEWDEKGNLIKEEIYENGKLVKKKKVNE